MHTVPRWLSSTFLLAGRLAGRSSLPRVSAPCEADITRPLWREQYRIQLPFSKGRLLCARRLNICFCTRTWPQSLTALNTAVNTLHLGLFLFFFFLSFLPRFFLSVQIPPLKITWIEPRFYSHSPPTHTHTHTPHPASLKWSFPSRENRR